MEELKEVLEPINQLRIIVSTVQIRDVYEYTVFTLVDEKSKKILTSTIAWSSDEKVKIINYLKGKVPNTYFC